MKLKATLTPAVEIYGKDGATKRFAKFTKPKILREFR